MVYQRCILELPCTEIAKKKLNVDPSTVYRAVNCLKKLGLFVAFKDTVSLPLKNSYHMMNLPFLMLSWTNNLPQGCSATLAANHWH